MAALPASLSARSFPFTPACPELYTHRSVLRWMSTIDTVQSGLPIPLFTFCSKLIESERDRTAVLTHDSVQIRTVLLNHTAEKARVRSCKRRSHIVQELCESRGGRPGLSVLTSLLVSVDVKLY